MKTKWITPRTEIETFIPNEYIAACWGVACEWQVANSKEHAPGINHQPDHCGQANNQVVYDDNNDGYADRMIETGTDGLGDLPCIVDGGINNVKIGDYIYWTTSASDGRTWHHEGRVINSVPGHPNASI